MTEKRKWQTVRWKKKERSGLSKIRRTLGNGENKGTTASRRLTGHQKQVPPQKKWTQRWEKQRTTEGLVGSKHAVKQLTKEKME